MERKYLHALLLVKANHTILAINTRRRPASQILAGPLIPTHPHIIDFQLELFLRGESIVNNTGWAQ